MNPMVIATTNKFGQMLQVVHPSGAERSQLFLIVKIKTATVQPGPTAFLKITRNMVLV